MKVRISVDIQFCPTFEMTINVPSYRDKEEYIDEFLDGLLNEDLKYNCDWKEVV